jgi:two-component system, NarL family, sensor histidine kinase UhpB
LPLDINPLFDALMLGISEEAFLIDAKSMRLLAASDSAISVADIGLQGMQKIDLHMLLGVNEDTLSAFMASQAYLSKLANPENKSSTKPNFFQLNHLNLALINIANCQYLLAVKNGLYANDETESRFKALVTNTPGLVFEFQLNDKDEIVFGYLSEGCKALLGIEANELKKSSKKLIRQTDKGDWALLKENIQTSATQHTMLNWEGRVWIDEWQDTKWVNLRAIPRKLVNGAIQWEGIMTNITQSKREKFELEQSRQRLAELSAHMDHIKEEERSRIAREIHDDLGGNLTVIKIGLGSMLKRIPEDQQALADKAKELVEIVDNTFEAAHRISGDLRPNILELGIVAALEWQAKQFEKQMDIPCHFTTNHADAIETKEQAITLFRICQEAMSNIAKYAKAGRVDVALFFNKDDIKMYITDDGVGINASDMLKPNSFGLRGMAERAAALGGSFLIEKAADKGTNIVVILPNQTGTGI